MAGGARRLVGGGWRRNPDRRNFFWGGGLRRAGGGWHLCGDGPPATDEQPLAPPEDRLHLGEERPEHHRVQPLRQQPRPPREAQPHEPPHGGGPGPQALLHALLQDVPDLGHRGHEGRAEGLDPPGRQVPGLVARERHLGLRVQRAGGLVAAGGPFGGDGLGVAVADLGAEDEHGGLRHQLQDVRGGEVRQVDLLAPAEPRAQQHVLQGLGRGTYLHNGQGAGLPRPSGRSGVTRVLLKGGGGSKGGGWGGAVPTPPPPPQETLSC